jgi:aspartate/tyrosine/aromatic aminotransferase
MFEKTELLPADPILGLSKLFREDERADKIDLGVGVYRTPDGKTPIMKAVREGQNIVVSNETTKAYTPADGAPGFADNILKLVLGEDSVAYGEGHCAAVQTPGGCGALRLAGEILARSDLSGLTVGSPTWANHIPLLSSAGVKINSIPYYDTSKSEIDFDAFLEGVRKLGPQDVLLVHGCCHNPTGADLSESQINQLIELALERGFLPFIDTAYHGFAKGLEKDAWIVRQMVERLPEVLVSYSCSKNFGLYRERTGALIYKGSNSERTNAIHSQAINIARGIYSMPPAHGGAIVNEILSSTELTAMWREELEEMRTMVVGNRQRLVAAAQATGLGNRLGFIGNQYGMFSLLPISNDAVEKLRTEHGVYVVGGGRINLCGVNESNVQRLVSVIEGYIA